MDLIQWPFIRLTYAGIDNPLFVDDILAADQAVLAAAKALCGVNDTDFRIISGLDYVPGAPNSYTPGVFYLNGLFYAITTTFFEGLYLTANIQPTLSKGFDDGNSRYIYSIQLGTTSNVSTGNSPLFMGNMNQYRIGMKYLGGVAVSFNNLVAALGSAAYLNTGQIAGTVAAGDDPRLVYTLTQLDQKYAQVNNVIIKGGGTSYTPTAPTDPVNKAYSDSTSGRRLASGQVHIGDADTGAGNIRTISLGQTITVPYTVLFSIVSNSVNPITDLFFHVNVRNKLTTSFDLYFREVQGNVQDVSVEWIIFAQ